MIQINMARGTNKDFIVAGIRNLLERNYKIESDLIDLEAEVDCTLTFSENWYHIYSTFVRPIGREVLCVQ